MTRPGATRPPRGGSHASGDGLVPLLQLGGGAPDPVAIATWYLALSASLADQVPHDLFALWLFPSGGGAVLLGPEALAQDRVAVPEPAPHLLQDQLYTLEEVLRRASYESAMAVPIRSGSRDAGVILIGSFARGSYGPGEALLLHRLAAQLGPSFGSLSERMSATTPHVAVEPVMSLDELPEHLARASCEAADGPDLVRRASGILYPLLPHDRLEILVAGSPNGPWTPLSGQFPKRRWSATGGAVDPLGAIVSRFDVEETLLLDDLTASVTEVTWTADPTGGSSLPIRGVVGTRLLIAGETIGFLIFGSVAENAYRPEDEELAAAAGRFLAPRAGAIRIEAERDGRRAEASVSSLPALRFAGAAAALADTAHLGAALSLFAAELHAAIGYEGFAIHLRWGENQVVAVDPEAPRPLADLPVIPIATFDGAPVLSGDRAWMVRSVEEGEEVLVPLRVAGRPVGTLSIRSEGFGDPREAAASAQPFADLLAPHLELLRRGSSPAYQRPTSRTMQP
jgi:GAF domain-containing protein